MIDVSFISIRAVLKSVADHINENGLIIAMVKPQFEAGKDQLNKGIVKNSRQRREILQNFEQWCLQDQFVILKNLTAQLLVLKAMLSAFIYSVKAKSILQ